MTRLSVIMSNFFVEPNCPDGFGAGQTAFQWAHMASGADMTPGLLSGDLRGGNMH